MYLTSVAIIPVFISPFITYYKRIIAVKDIDEFIRIASLQPEYRLYSRLLIYLANIPISECQEISDNTDII